MRERLFQFRFKDGTTREGAGRDAVDAFDRLGLGALADKLDSTKDVTPRRGRNRAPQEAETAA